MTNDQLQLTYNTEKGIAQVVVSAELIIGTSESAFNEILDLACRDLRRGLTYLRESRTYD